jgi:DNA-binding NarL/FixJ family response regulator
MIKILIVDDHLMVAESLFRLLQREDDLVVVGVATSGHGGLALLDTEVPDIVLMDYRLPDADGISIGTQMLRRLPATRLVLLTATAGPQTLAAALGAGFTGCLQKTAPLDHLTSAIRRAAAGELVLSPAELARILPNRQRGTVQLTDREYEVLRLMAEGFANQAIADRLIISRNTVRKHVQAILTKLGAHAKLEAVAVAKRAGMLETA